MHKSEVVLFSRTHGWSRGSRGCFGKKIVRRKKKCEKRAVQNWWTAETARKGDLAPSQPQHSPSTAAPAPANQHSQKRSSTAQKKQHRSSTEAAQKQHRSSTEVQLQFWTSKKKNHPGCLLFFMHENCN